jgi:general stress protein YciG
MSWFGNSKGHAEAGRKGGLKQSKDSNPANFFNDREKARMAGRKGGKAKKTKRNARTKRSR